MSPMRIQAALTTLGVGRDADGAPERARPPRRSGRARPASRPAATSAVHRRRIELDGRRPAPSTASGAPRSCSSSASCSRRSRRCSGVPSAARRRMICSEAIFLGAGAQDDLAAPGSRPRRRDRAPAPPPGTAPRRCARRGSRWRTGAPRGGRRPPRARRPWSGAPARDVELGGAARLARVLAQARRARAAPAGRSSSALDGALEVGGGAAQIARRRGGPARAPTGTPRACGASGARSASVRRARMTRGQSPFAVASRSNTRQRLSARDRPRRCAPRAAAPRRRLAGALARRDGRAPQRDPAVGLGGRRRASRSSAKPGLAIAPEAAQRRATYASSASELPVGRVARAADLEEPRQQLADCSRRAARSAEIDAAPGQPLARRRARPRRPGSAGAGSRLARAQRAPRRRGPTSR